MKRIITAIGNKELNNILKEQEEIMIESPDIQYQEGITEALEKYPLTDIVILKDDIMGEMNLEDLILSITIVKNDIEIILITEEGMIENKNVVKLVTNKESYVNEVVGFLSEKLYIKFENVNNIQRKIEDETEVRKEEIQRKFEVNNTVKNLLKKRKERRERREIITFIGKEGIRKNNCDFNISKATEE